MVSRSHTAYKRGAFIFAEIFIRIVHLHADPFVQALTIAYFAARNWRIDALALGAQASAAAAPAHFHEQLMTFIALFDEIVGRLRREIAAEMGKMKLRMFNL